uniref:Uncharacterized protein n=1 Tax=viral metagenome TaxID=1070528 RepID=A0A6C0DEM4_9ZZZZ
MTKKVAIYNGLPCHYEMFGYIIYFCLVKNYTLEIFTEKIFDTGWLQFYTNIFQSYINFKYRAYDDFENEDVRNNFDIIFLTTDDDCRFKYNWMNQKVICINHYYKCRRIDYFDCLGVRPFIENKIKWGLPCFPVFDNHIKIINNDVMNVCIVGGGNLETNLYNTSVINRLKSKKKIVLHIITRFVTKNMFTDMNIQSANESIEIRLYQRINTDNMFQVLRSVNYMLTDVTINNDHNTGYSMSGSIPLAFSSLSRIIISSQNNKLYKFSSALEFDLTTNDDIFLHDNTDETTDLIVNERDTLVKMFHDNVDEIIDKNKL